MPLSDDGRFVTRSLKQLGKRLLITIKSITVIHKAIQVAMLARLNDGSTWTTNAVGAEAVAKQHSVRSQLVDVGCLVKLRALATQIRPAQIID